MSAYQWQTVTIQDIRKKRIKGPRIIIGAYGVGPSLIGRGRFTSSVWTVDHRSTGCVVAFYTDFNVALNFAHRLQRDYGDITEFAKRLLKGALTDSDTALAKELNIRRKHVTWMHDRDWEDYKGPLTLFDQSQYPLDGAK